MKNARLALFILVSCVLGLLAAAGFYLAFAPDEETQDAPLSQAEIHGPLMRLGQPPRPVPTPTPAPTLAPASVLVVTPVPIPVPTPAPTPEIAGDKTALTALVHATFPNDPYMGNYVAWHESLKFDEGEWQGYVYGGVWSETGDCGLMQINWRWHHEKFAAHGWTEADCFIPERNLVIAREIYDGSGGCGPWSTC